MIYPELLYPLDLTTVYEKLNRMSEVKYSIYVSWPSFEQKIPIMEVYRFRLLTTGEILFREKTRNSYLITIR